MGFHDVLGLLIATIVGCKYILSKHDLEWDSISPLHVASSDYLNPIYFTAFRVTAGLIVWSLIFYLLFDREGLKITVVTRNGSHKLLHLKHGSRFTVFTVWCWCIQGMYFLLTSLYSICNLLAFDLSVVLGSPVYNRLALIIWVLFEVCFSTAFLVTLVVTFILIPGVKSQGIPADNFFRTPSVMMHNLNAVFMVTELILNKLHFSLWHFPFVLLFGVAYVVFQWYWVTKTDAFYYFFLDYNKKFALLWYLALMIFIGGFFFLGYWANYFLLFEEHSKWSIMGLVVFTLFSMKLYDK